MSRCCRQDRTTWCVRAAELLRQRAGFVGGARIELKKRIPLAAGLAGGSSDAAATLDGLNKLWRLGWDRSKLTALAAEIGSDVAFFFHTPAAWCTGRGEVVTPCSLGRPLDFLLVCPDVGLSTAEVYRNVAVPSRPREGDEIRRGDRGGRCASHRSFAAQSFAAGGREALSASGAGASLNWRRLGPWDRP